MSKNWFSRKVHRFRDRWFVPTFRHAQVVEELRLQKILTANAESAAKRSQEYTEALEKNKNLMAIKINKITEYKARMVNDSTAELTDSIITLVRYIKWLEECYDDTGALPMFLPENESGEKVQHYGIFDAYACAKMVDEGTESQEAVDMATLKGSFITEPLMILFGLHINTSIMLPDKGPWSSMILDIDALTSKVEEDLLDPEKEFDK